ncbi:MAG: COX15/CtaA family protein [Bacteroidota bacterium]
MAKIALILVYLVIVAGAVVRMTGSGMGCPDWPKCFGYYIPPTQESQLLWESGKAYKRGQVIIRDQTLWSAKMDFTTARDFQLENWMAYTKHDYAVFNPWHTWIEFVNRLLGALAGLGTLVLALLSLKFWKKHKRVTLISWLVVFAMGFQAWLGATVVYSVLEPVKITIHMVMALIIVALLLYVVYLAKPKNVPSLPYSKGISQLLGLALFTTLAQIVLGTQVRQFVDEQVKRFGDASQQWLQDPSLPFYIHRSFSIFVVLLNLYIAYRIFKLGVDTAKINWILGILLLEVITGMVMYYWEFPFASQPLHLVLASVLFGLQFYLALESRASAA